MPLVIVSVGDRFGKLVVTRVEAGERGGLMASCLCECGTTRTLKASRLKNYGSCGCYKRARIGIASRGRKVGNHKVHGMSKKGAEYGVWGAMRSRCTLPSQKCFPHYGGRGIKVCERWQTFANFIADMGLRPTPKHTLDRINTNGDYEPNNCRWATRREQMRNTRKSKMLEYRGETRSLSEWVQLLGLSYPMVAARLKRGRSIEEAFEVA